MKSLTSVARKVKTGVAVGMCLLSMALAGTVYGFGIEIEVAPNTLNIGSSGVVVTIHTNIRYGDVVAHSVTLNDIVISSWKADSRGYFVAKFLMSEVKDLAQLELPVIPESYLLVLEGQTVEGTDFNGVIDISVIDVEPVGTGKR